jgi:hypothetical protein
MGAKLTMVRNGALLDSMGGFKVEVNEMLSIFFKKEALLGI